MTNTFSDFFTALLELVNTYEKKNVLLKIENDLEENIIRIYGEKISSVSKAKHSLQDVIELAYSTAEHHPFWGLIYHCSQISKLSLDKWDDDLTKEELDEILWSIDELKNACEKLGRDK